MSKNKYNVNIYNYIIIRFYLFEYYRITLISGPIVIPIQVE